MKKKKVAAVFFSDVHLGSRVCKAERVVAMLDTFDPIHIFILGDLYDDLNLHRLHKEHWELLNRLREYSKKKHVLHIHGNHDWLLEPLGEFLGLDVVSEYIWEYNGKRMLLIHGHQFDDYVTNMPVVTEIASFLYLCAQRIDKKQWFARFLKRKSKKYLRLSNKIAIRLSEYAKKAGADIAIFGHTHEPMDEVVNNIRIINDGCATDAPSMCVICELDGTLHHYEMKDPNEK